MTDKDFLLEVSQLQSEELNAPQSCVKILTWNIQNPSLHRAKQQAEWLLTRDAHVLILTEVKVSQGCLFLQAWLESNDFVVLFPRNENNDYGVIIAIKSVACQESKQQATFLPHRAVTVLCEPFFGKTFLMGLYVPSRGPKESRNEKKKQFQHEISTLMGSWMQTNQERHLIVAGDLNVLERHHIPHYPIFGEWEYTFYESFLCAGLRDAYRFLHPDDLEYSWFGRAENGYRFDHCFVSPSLLAYIKNCFYVHEVRSLKLSDHSAMYLEMIEAPCCIGPTESSVHDRVTGRS